MCDIDEILDEFEEAWRTGDAPDFQQYERRLPEKAYQEAVSDLMQIDLEHRWKVQGDTIRLTLADYLKWCRLAVSTETQISVLCREFGVRNRWGDCIGRREICEKYPLLESGFLQEVDRQINDIAKWPTVELTRAGEPLVAVQLDRTVQAGRSKDQLQPPDTVVTTSFLHRMNLCDMLDATLSREQLSLTLAAPDVVQIENCSRNRALAVRGHGVLEPGAEVPVELRRTIAVSLGQGRYLMIEPPLD